MDAWTDKSITLNTQYMFSKGESTYKFPEKVLKPEFSQQDVWDSTMPEVMQEFTMMGGRDVFFLTYG